jgi:3'-phosphoadenosine 5'-phosphosulfate sulfotransferase (PAPS reductase)/FAD synthetase/ferredoxin
MFKITWDKETRGVKLTSFAGEDTIGVSPRPVFFEELNLLKLNELGWRYPHCKEPLLWACNKQYFYRGKLVFEVKGANIYDSATVILQPDAQNLQLKPVDISGMLEKNNDEMFLIESEAIEFIRNTYTQYSSGRKSVENEQANQIDFEKLAAIQTKKTKQQMAIVKEDCDSFDIMPLESAKNAGKKVYQTTRIDKFIASFSGGKDSQVVLDLCFRAIPPHAFEVIYSDTGYELPPSLALYEEIKKHYPKLKFSTVRNHETVLNYWDKIGTPSDTHRWCCSVMKTAPLYRSLKIEGTNRQARVLTFDGVRAEESTRRSNYNRIGKGVKHNTVINARPILDWNTTEIFLYLFKYNLFLNPAYRQGMTRVGCLICPFSSEWNENIAQNFYKQELYPFVNRLENIALKSGVKDVNEYIKAGNWKRRASGNLIDRKTQVVIKQAQPNFIVQIENPQLPFNIWIHTIGEVTMQNQSDKIYGELRFKKVIYKFEVQTIKANLFQFTLFDGNNGALIGLLKRICYKTAYCINCEACEVECPTGALAILPEVKIDKSKCIHCYKCLEFHDKGCIMANSLTNTTGNNMNAQTSIDRYKNFGLKEEWISFFFADPKNFLDSNHGLNPQYQIPSLRNWLKDAEIIDETWKLTKLGSLLSQIFQDNSDLVWEIIWINLTYNSFIAKWYATRVMFEKSFNKTMLEEIFQSEFPVYKGKTIHNAIYQIIRTLKESPIGSIIRQYIQEDKENALRCTHDNLSAEAIAYSIYKYSEKHNIKMIRVSDFYRTDIESGVFKEFGISKTNFENQLRKLNSAANRVLIAELNMGLDHITLREDLDSIDALMLLAK